MAPTSSVMEFRNRKDSESDEDEFKYLNLNDSPTKTGPRRFGPLVVIFVGLPGRGKTVLAHKLERYLIWTNRKAQVFNVSSYRRKHIESYDSHDLFRVDNIEAFEIRQLSIHEAQQDAVKWLKSGGEVAIMDGPHATNDIRQNAYNYFWKKNGYKVLFVECLCDDEELLERNEKEILQFSKDYRQMSTEKASIDFHYKIEHYKEQYESMDSKIEPDHGFIKVFNGGQSLLAHRLEGPTARDVLQYISCLKTEEKTYYFSRHGESENNMLGKIGGDANLSARGRMYAAALARYFNEADIPDFRVWTSEKKRTKQTAQEIDAPKEHITALNELDAGVCEGLSYEEMQEQYPQEFAWRDQDKLRYRYPWGESYVDIMTRLHPVLTELESENNLLVISHQAVLRCILGYFLNKRIDELPYINVPLHTIIKLTTYGYKYKMEIIKLNVECVDTYRKKPQNCSVTRAPDDALKTVPSHFDNLKPAWICTAPLIPQH
ncbi:6-phosphofructo-2-kinase/fructose-2,6-bisphosphatase-like [Planococcus citri]|uniref:6-phosphofructo-2-kinase/fructose-2, 6-bisphosphatase-like n=1 Tax=Planococcus citri TaxID=170843 RepID=UPI0031F8BEC8